jgi:hypothetical protein
MSNSHASGIIHDEPTKDIVEFIIPFEALSILLLNEPYVLGDPDNFIPANNKVCVRSVSKQLTDLYETTHLEEVSRNQPQEYGDRDAFLHQSEEYFGYCGHYWPIVPAPDDR